MRLIFGAAIGAALAYFMDPERGDERRGMAMEKAGKLLQQGKQQTFGAAEYAANVAKGGSERPNDPTLARKVESEIFRDDASAKGAVSVNVENGTVFLRGEVDDGEMITRLGDLAGQVDGIEGVENLLHTPGTPAPTKTT